MTAEASFADSDYRCFCDYERIEIPRAESGPLSGLRFAVKDLFDVAGYPTGCGHPQWPGRDEARTETASVVTSLLDAGAECLGKTVTDEIAFSLTGRNAHYGTPINPAAPDRVPGGSSSGSAVATAAGLVDFALGTDTAGSIRVPASYCGLFGIRPTHGRLSLDHCMPLAPSYDTVGWFARTGRDLQAVGDVLLEADHAPPAPFCLVVSTAIDYLDADTRPGFDEAIRIVVPHFRRVFSAIDMLLMEEDWGLTFRITQASEVWKAMAPWIEEHNPTLGPGIRERMDWARSLTEDEIAFHNDRRATIQTQLRARIGDDMVLLVPTAPSAAPLLSVPDADLEDYRKRLIALSCLAGLAGLPQVTMPLARTRDGAPVGLSLIGAPGADRTLLALAATIGDAIGA